jgi:hypothetical protein
MYESSTTLKNKSERLLEGYLRNQGYEDFDFDGDFRHDETPRLWVALAGRRGFLLEAKEPFSRSARNISCSGPHV